MSANAVNRDQLGTDRGVKLLAYKVSELVSGIVTVHAEFRYFHNLDGSLTKWLVPADRMDTPGSPMYFVNAANSGHVMIWTITDPYGTQTVTANQINVDAFADPPSAIQPGTTATINTGLAIIDHAQFRAGGIWATQNTSYSYQGAPPRSAIRMYQFQTASPGLYDQFTIQNPNLDLYYASFATDASGNLIVQWCFSGSNDYASIAYSGADQLSTLQNGFYIATYRVKKAGVGAYTQPQGRWGDYTGAAWDPTTRSTVYLFNQYTSVPSASDQWDTWLYSAAFLSPQVYTPIIMR
jgi:hypothetical protein